MRRRDFVKAIGGVIGGFACYDATAISGNFRKAWKHATSRQVHWVGRKGLWTEAVNWSNQRVPDENTDVTIGRDKDGCRTVVIIPADTDVFVHDLTVQNEAVLRMDSNATVHGDMTLETCRISGRSTITMW